MAMDDELHRRVQEAVNRNPELVEKYGNPLDENDPRNWMPSKRVEQGLPIEDQLKYLGLDLELMTQTVANLVVGMSQLKNDNEVLLKFMMDTMKNRFIEKMKTDPDGALVDLEKLLRGMPSNPNPGSWGPLENNPDASIRYAGSARGMSPDQMVETPNGIIRADEIPGYKNDPNWEPSPDWSEANCMCPGHVANREASKGVNPFGIDPFKDDGPPNGMYL
jgi:hypothetical protein